MIHQSQPTMSARDVTRILFRHKRKGILFFFAVITLAVVGVLLLPKKYESEAKFFVKLNLKVDPIATNDGQTVFADPEREGEMRSVVALLHSRGLLEKIVEELGPDKIFETDLKKGVVDSLVASITSLIPASGDGAEIDREKAVRKLAKTLKIDHPKKSHVVAVSYKSRSAERAKEILDSYVATSMKQHLEVNRNSNSYDFFVEQEQLLEQQVVDAEGELRDAKNQIGLVSLGGQRRVLEDHVTLLDKQTLDNQSDLAATTDRIETLRKELPFDMQNPSSASSLSTRSLDEMRNQLFTHELRYRELLARFRPDHPKVTAVKEQIDEARTLLNLQQLRNEMSSAESLRSKQQTLRDDFEATLKRLQKLNEDEVRLAELERRLRERTAAHQVYVRKMEQARLDSQLEADQISNLRVAQAPTLMGKALSRKGALICALAVVVGVCGAVGLAYVLELMDQSLATAADVESSLGVPVLVSLPRSRARDLSLN